MRLKFDILIKMKKINKNVDITNFFSKT